MVFIDFYCSLRVGQAASNGPSGGAPDSDGGSEDGGSEAGRKGQGGGGGGCDLPSTRPQVTFEMIVVAVFPFAMYVSLCLFICFVLSPISLYLLLLMLRLSQRRRSPVPPEAPRPRPGCLRRRVGKGCKGQVATTLAAATPQCQVSFSVIADIFRCSLVSFIFMQFFFQVFFYIVYATHTIHVFVH
jgi:hypothetical protein